MQSGSFKNGRHGRGCAANTKRIRLSIVQKTNGSPRRAKEIRRAALKCGALSL